MKNCLLLLLFSSLFPLFGTQVLRAQTSLGPGDIAFTMINTDADDAFAFVLLKDVTAGTNFDITDKEYRSGALNSGEGIIRITFNQASGCGSEFLFISSNNDGNYAGSRITGSGSAAASIIEGSLTLSTGGDGLIAFQNGTYITIMQKCGFGFGNGDSACSDLPPGLTEGSNAIAYTNNLTGDQSEPDNMKYDCTPNNGTPAQISSALATNSNWLEDDANAFSYGSGCGFSCQAACTDPTISGFTVSPNNVCPGTPVTLTINGSLGDAAEWVLRTGNCNGPAAQTTTGNTFTVNPASTTTYSITALDCNNNQICTSGTVTRLVNAADAGADIFLAGGPVTLSGNNPSPGSGTWSILSGAGGSLGNAGAFNSSFSGMAGEAYVLRWTVSGGGCATTIDDVEISFAGGITDLTAGDVAFTGYNSDQPDDFSFVLLREVTAGTSIGITDNGWVDGSGFRSGEGAIIVSFNRPYACGSSIYVSRATTFVPYTATDDAGRMAGEVATTAETGNTVPEIATSGDQLFAYQGTFANPTLLAGIMVNGAWGAGSVDNGFSDQPPALTGNNTSVNIVADVDNAKYDCSVTGGLPGVLRTAINDADNWNTSNELIALTPTCGFTCAVCAEPVITSLSILPASPVCAGQETTITVDGDLMGATRWVVYAPGDCGGAILGSSTGGNTLTFTPDGSGTYLVAGIEGCVATPVCSSLPLMQTGEVATITMDRPSLVDGTSVALTALAPGPAQVGTWAIVSGSDDAGVISGTTFTGTGGGSYVLSYTLSGNGCPSTSDSVTVSFFLDGNLALGDIMFSGYNSLPEDNFSVVVIADFLPAGEAFSITDKGWFSAGGLRTVTETTAGYLLSVPLRSGDQIRFESDGNGYGADGAIVARLESGTFPAVSSIGDQLFLFDGLVEPTAADQSQFVSAIQMNCENGICSESAWDGDATDISSSALPPVFAGTDFVLYGGGSPLNNARYDCSLPLGPTRSDKLVGLSDPANWLFQDNPSYDLADVCETFSPVLPVEWLSFGAAAGAKQVELQWRTSYFAENAGFHVERSARDGDWTVIATVAARPETTDQSYRFTDGAPLDGQSYYRVRQTDFDGTVTYSRVASVLFTGEELVQIFPNPASDEVTLYLPAGARLLGVSDVTGRVMQLPFAQSANRFTTNVATLSEGMYFLRVLMSDGNSAVHRLMVR